MFCKIKCQEFDKSYFFELHVKFSGIFYFAFCDTLKKEALRILKTYPTPSTFQEPTNF